MQDFAPPIQFKNAENCTNISISNPDSLLDETNRTALSPVDLLPAKNKAALPQPTETTVLQIGALDSLYTAILDAIGGRLDKDSEIRLVRGAERNPCRDHSIQRTRELAAAFHRTMPNHWTAGFGTSLNGFVRRAISDRLKDSEDYDLVFSAILFRWQYMGLIDRIVSNFGLPKPGGKSCAMWDFVQWKVSRGGRLYCTDPNFWKEFSKANCILEPHELQKAIPFYLPLRYLHAALTEAREVYLSVEDGCIMVQEIVTIISEEEESLRQCFASTAPNDKAGQGDQGTLLE